MNLSDSPSRSGPLERLLITLVVVTCMIALGIAVVHHGRQAINHTVSKISSSLN